ncbi:MAG: alpha/beta hydrolase [Actinobacteria bacterium]|nr:MAG: alpha/beta hydrolase [Actinomycetota bacterium]
MLLSVVNNPSHTDSATTRLVSNSVLPPIVMVHGWGGSHQQTWQKPGIQTLIEEIGRTVIGVDLLGHGQAEKPHDPAVYGDISSPIREATQNYPIDAVGFSLGAIALLHAATINPRMFRKLVLIGIGDKIFEAHDPQETKRIISGIDKTADQEDTLAYQFGNYARQPGNDVDALRAMLQRPRGESFTKQNASTIVAEVLVIVGDRDFVLPADQLVAAFQTSRFKLLKNCDHFASTENFKMIDELLEFFKN